jgi:hypothetical protein
MTYSETEILISMMGRLSMELETVAGLKAVHIILMATSTLFDILLEVSAKRKVTHVQRAS